MDELKKTDLVKYILDEVDDELSNEELIHLILKNKISESTYKKNERLSDKAADKIAHFAGSWKFVISFTSILLFWIIINTILSFSSFDPFPFVLLNLVLSCIAALQAPLILMSQNKQDERDRKRAENDYMINLKSEIIIEAVYKNLEKMIDNQNEILEISRSKEILKKKGDTIMG